MESKNPSFKQYSITNDEGGEITFFNYLPTGMREIYEVFMDEVYRTVSTTNVCSGYKYCNFDKYLVAELNRGIEDRPKKRMLTRWYNKMDPKTGVHHGDYSFGVTIECPAKNRIKVTIDTKYMSNDGHEHSNVYTLSKIDEVRKLIKCFS